MKKQKTNKIQSNKSKNNLKQQKNKRKKYNRNNKRREKNINYKDNLVKIRVQTNYWIRTKKRIMINRSNNKRII